MTDEQLAKANKLRESFGFHNVTFSKAYIDATGLQSGTVDVVISNGVINLAPDKRQVFDEIWRVLKAGGVVQFADIANGNDVPEEAMRHIDLWTG